MIAILGDNNKYYSSFATESEEIGTEFPLKDYGNLLNTGGKKTMK